MDNLIYLLFFVAIAIVAGLFYFVPVNLWIAARFSGVPISIGQLIGMKLRRVQPKIIVDELIKAGKAGLTDVKSNTLEAHYLAKGNISRVVDALISAQNAKQAGITLSFQQAAAIDLAGRDVLQAVKDSVIPKVIDSPPVEAVALDGVQVIAVARITVRALLDKLIGSAGEETIVARVGQGIVSSIGSAQNHDEIMSNPGKISDLLMRDGMLTDGTAYEVLSIDIADIDLGTNVGAKLKADQAAAELQVARAKAEEKRANAVAEEQHYRAEVQHMRAKLIEAEAEVPAAMAQAFREGNLGIHEYHRLQNMEADTRMRRSFSEMDEHEEDDDQPSAE